MLAKVTSCALVGLEGVIVDVEVDASRGMPSLIIVGLPDAAVKESRGCLIQIETPRYHQSLQ